MFQAKLSIDSEEGRTVAPEEIGVLVAERIGREKPFDATTVGRWFTAKIQPSLAALQEVARLARVDPGWLAFGDASAAPVPAIAQRPQGSPEPQEPPKAREG